MAAVLKFQGQRDREAQAAWKKERRGTRAKYSHLWNRTYALLEYLEKVIEPELQTVRKARYDEVAQPVKNLLGK